jgi:hypothetical protein
LIACFLRNLKNLKTLKKSLFLKDGSVLHLQVKRKANTILLDPADHATPQVGDSSNYWNQQSMSLSPLVYLKLKEYPSFKTW